MIKNATQTETELAKSIAIDALHRGDTDFETFARNEMPLLSAKQQDRIISLARQSRLG